MHRKMFIPCLCRFLFSANVLTDRKKAIVMDMLLSLFPTLEGHRQ